MNIAEKIGGKFISLDSYNCKSAEDTFITGANAYRNILKELSLFTEQELQELFGEDIHNIKDVICVLTYDQMMVFIKDAYDSCLKEDLKTLINKYGKDTILSAISELSD